MKTRPRLVPDLERDVLTGILLSVHNENAKIDLGELKYRPVKIALLLRDACDAKQKEIALGMGEKVQLIFVKNEIALLQKFIELVRVFDPDVLLGYETELMSIGYVCKRA